MATVLVTGAAGFIGFHLCQRLLSDGHRVIGVDNLNNYYDPNLKLARLKELGITQDILHSNYSYLNSSGQFNFIKSDIEEDGLWDKLGTEFEIEAIIHLAAQAGVRYSLENPKSYIKSNIDGFLNVLEFCRNRSVNNLIYASSSSVYGMDSVQPFSEEESCNKPVSLYAATKRSNELMAHTYHHLFGIHSIGLRFFTVYGPWGRPDMAPFLFTKAAFEGTAIKVFNQGNQSRDFTYIDDIVNGIVEIFRKREIVIGAEVCNIGQGNPCELMEFIGEVEKSTGLSLEKEFADAQPGDVAVTYADTRKFQSNFSVKPQVLVSEGVGRFVNWFKDYYKF